MGLLSFTKSYPIPAIVYKKRGNAWLFTVDSVRREKDKNNIERLFFKKTKITNSPPAFDQLLITEKGRTVMQYAELQTGNLVPVHLNTDGVMVDLEPEDKEMYFWKVMEDRNTQSRYGGKRGFWAEYGYLIIIMATVAVLAFTVIYTNNTLTSIAGIGGSAAEQGAKAALLAAEAANKLANILGKVSPTAPLT